MPNTNAYQKEKDYNLLVDELLLQQTQDWELARTNYQGLQSVVSQSLHTSSGIELQVQFNPERMRSSAAKVDAKSISERKCFLCPAHLPPQQRGIEFGDDYLILVNPFPIFPRHLTIPVKSHIDQRIAGRLNDMFELAKAIDQYVVFYNGPKCGASAPDHFHFQAGNKGFMPIEREFETLQPQVILQQENNQVFIMQNYLRATLVLQGDDREVLQAWFNRFYQLLQERNPQEAEPMMNILMSWHGNHWRMFIFPRREHRPRQFFAEGAQQILFSPASVDFGGVLITPREEDFHKLNIPVIEDIFSQVSLLPEEWNNLITRFAQP